MKDLLERVRELNRPADPIAVEAMIDSLGDSPSIATLEAVLKFYKDEEKAIRTKDLLEWMQENDQTSFETEDFKVTINTYISAKVLDANIAFKWLEEHQYGDLIKDKLEFPKGEFSQDAAEALESLGLSYTRKSEVHPQTLKKVMRDLYHAGELLPDEDQGFSVGYYDECIVKGK